MSAASTDMNMTRERHLALERDQSLKLTPLEITEGWYFCCEWDGMLIHESHPEAECCTCDKRVRDDGAAAIEAAK